MTDWTLHQRADNRKWYVHWRDDGKLIRKSCDTHDKQLARQRARQIMAGHFKAATLPERIADAKKLKAERATMNQLFDEAMKVIWTPAKIRSSATLDSNLKVLRGLIGADLVQTVDKPRLERLVQQLRAQNYAEGTIYRKMTTLGAALSYATELTDGDGKLWLAGKPKMPKLVVDNFKDRYLSKAEEKAVFAAIAARQALEPMRDWRRFGFLVRFLLDEGCRLAEALNLTDARIRQHVINDVERWSAEFPRYTTKSKKPRTVWLTKAVIGSLDYLRMTAVNGHLFPFKAATAWYMWKTIREDVTASGMNIDDVVLHTLRHTCLTRMSQSGKMKMHEISEWAGHASVQITVDRYDHHSPADRAHLVDILDDMAA